MPHHFVLTAALRGASRFTGNRYLQRAFCGLAGRRAGDAAVRSAVHRDDHGQHDQRVSGRTAPSEPRGRSGTAVGPADADHWFNTAAFANPATSRSATRRARCCAGLAFATTDLTLEKSIPLTDRVKFDVRVEAYNLLNRANFNSRAPRSVRRTSA